MPLLRLLLASRPMTPRWQHPGGRRAGGPCERQAAEGLARHPAADTHALLGHHTVGRRRRHIALDYTPHRTCYAMKGFSLCSLMDAAADARLDAGHLLSCVSQVEPGPCRAAHRRGDLPRHAGGWGSYLLHRHRASGRRQALANTFKSLTMPHHDAVVVMARPAVWTRCWAWTVKGPPRHPR